MKIAVLKIKKGQALGAALVEEFERSWMDRRGFSDDLSQILIKARGRVKARLRKRTPATDGRFRAFRRVWADVKGNEYAPTLWASCEYYEGLEEARWMESL